MQIAAQLNTYIGALPHPDILEAYERLVPGSAERLLAMAEQQATHRMGLEKRVVDHEVDQAKGGLAAGLLVTMGMEVISGILVFKGYPAQAIALGGASLVALAGVFIYGTRSRKTERIEKAKVMTEQMRLPLEGTDPSSETKASS